MEDTIAAISTPVGEGGISIVRISGARALAIADQVFFCSQGRPSTFPSHTIHFGKIGRNGDALDHVLLSIMRAPRTYTTEDTVEINCHGGMITARCILSLCLQCGARLAQPGEFTKRAFLNGRIDLTQAESVMDLISAKTERAHIAAVHGLEGHLSKRMQEVWERLLTVLAHIEAQIDFPEDDIAPASRNRLIEELKNIQSSLHQMLATAGEGKILREGVRVAIVGRPNVGKSSLLNALLGQDRAIVTPVAGTTRDTIEEFASIRGIPMRLIDTAGLRSARGRVETHGVKRTLNALHACDLVLLVMDQSRPYGKSDERLTVLCDCKPVVTVLNKADLPRRLRLPSNFAKGSRIAVSCHTGEGLDDLRLVLEEKALSGVARTDKLDITVNQRQADAIRCSVNNLTKAIDDFRSGLPLEFISQRLRGSLSAIGEIIGRTSSEDLLERIFSTFCIGK